jgi:hypothetical protein
MPSGMDDPKPRRRPVTAGRVVAAVAAALALAFVYTMCAPHQVVFRVSGDGAACVMDVTYRDGTGGTAEAHGVRPPWQSDAVTARYGADLYVLATGQCEVLECAVLVDGKEWRKNRTRLAVDCGGMLGEN